MATLQPDRGYLVRVEHCRSRLLVVALTLTNAGLCLDLDRLLLDLRGLAAELGVEQSFGIPFLKDTQILIFVGEISVNISSSRRNFV